MATKTIHKPLEWIESTLCFGPESPLSGQALKKYLLPFQRAIIRSALTPSGSPNRNIFMGLSRKIGKTEIYAWILCYLLCNRKGFHTGVMAASEQQAQVPFGAIQDQLAFNPKFNPKDFRVTKEKIVHKKNYSSCERLYFSPGALLGRRFSAILCDEIGAQKSGECLESLQSGLAFAQGGGLQLVASNPPPSSTHWSVAFVDNIRADKDWSVNEFAADPATPPYSELALKQSNPLYRAFKAEPKRYGHLKSVAKFLDTERKKAAKSEEPPLAYLRFQLGRKISTSSEGWIDGSELKVMPLAEVLAKNPSVIGGCDLSLSWDFCAFSLCYEWEDKTAFHSILHLPNLTGRTPRQQREFSKWHEKGMITIQDRPSLCKDSFVADVKKYIKDNKLKVRATIFDKGLMSQEWEDSLRFGETHLLAGTAANLSAGIGELQAQARAGRLFMTEENDCVRWQFSNALASSRSKGHRLLNRTSRRKSIDSPVSVVLAKWHHLKHPYRTDFIRSF